MPHGCIFQTSCFLNQATLLPNPEKDHPLHDCSEILAEALAARKDLTDVPLSNSELVRFTDGSSYVKDGQRKAGAAIVDDSGQTIWAETLLRNTSAQKARIDCPNTGSGVSQREESHHFY